MLVEIMKLTNLDLVDVEPVLEMIFGKFEETDPFNEKFAKAGYDSTNFILECGPLFLLILIFLAWAPIRKFTQLIAKQCKDNRLSKRLKAKTQFKTIVARFFIEGILELSIAAGICMVNIN